MQSEALRTGRFPAADVVISAPRRRSRAKGASAWGGRARVVIDPSSAFRLDARAARRAEITSEEMRSSTAGIIAGPNCTKGWR